jgi:hypothetical protein
LNCVNPHPLPLSRCPTCGYTSNAAKQIEGHSNSPTPGDISVCIKCGEALCFTETLHVRLAELNDLVKMDKELQDRLGRAQKVIREKRFLG